MHLLPTALFKWHVVSGGTIIVNGQVRAEAPFGRLGFANLTAWLSGRVRGFVVMPFILPMFAMDVSVLDFTVVFDFEFDVAANA